MTDLLLGPWPVAVAAVVLVVAGAATVVGAVRMASLGDTLAARTGWGEALFGAIFFGATTSLSGIVITAVSAASDSPQLAYSNAVGGIAAQTAAIAVADFFYRGSNLEHAAASMSNILFGWLLVALLILVVLTSYVPAVTVAGVHPMTAVITLTYLGGLVLVRRSGSRPMWQAVRTQATAMDDPDVPDSDERGTGSLWRQFALVGTGVGTGGAALAIAGESIVDATGLTAGFVGAVLLGVINALPETVTAIAAVRRRALTLAIAAILGGNCFDALNVAVGDLFYRSGSIYHTAGPDELFLTLASALMTVTVLGGLLIRQGRGPARVGFEGILLLGTYAATVTVLSV